MRHPDQGRLALYAGGDLGFFERLKLVGHVRTCEACRLTVEGYRRSREELRAACSAIPPGMDWDRVAAEMTANIRVGLAAGECVASAPARPKHLAWRPALAVLGLTAVVISGWWVNFPQEQRQSLSRGIARIWTGEARVAVDPSVYLEMNRAGIQLKENGSAMTLLHPSGSPSVISVSTQGSMRARYVDSDTGQITITNVYSQ